MLNTTTLETVWAPRVLSIVRVVSALIFMAHGTQKLLNFPPLAGGAAAPDLLSLYGIAGSLEIVGGILLLFGLFTRRSRSSSPAKWRSPTSWDTRRATSSPC